LPNGSPARRTSTATTSAATSSAAELGWIVVQDVVTGPLLSEYVGLFAVRLLHLVVLDPDAESVAQRERDRPKTGYTTWTVEESVAGHRRDTERIGLWIDSWNQAPDQTADELLARLDEARIA
jgi:hypothetical protein